MPSLLRRKKTYVIGDIHGCLDPLQALMAQLSLRKHDELLFIGDYIDRGPDAKGVVDYVLELRKSRPGKVTCLMGNHEWMLLNHLDGTDPVSWLQNGGMATRSSYGGEDQIPYAHLEFLHSLSPLHRTDDYLFVHAGIRPGVPLEAQSTEDMLWIRREFYLYPGRFDPPVVFGHTPLREVLIQEDRIGIDTGCVFGGKLTCLVLPEREVIQVKGIKADRDADPET
jgi:serine/threonine protein phosphatase 1